MKKKIIILIITIVLCTGCSISKVDTSSINNIVSSILYSDNKLHNVYMEGYKFYLPKNMKIVDKQDYNIKIRENDNNYFLYIDTVAYYFKTGNKFVSDVNHFYSEKIDYNDKIGFIDITDEDDSYFIVVMYNYAKIEALVPKEDLNNALISISSILSSIKYNDETIGINVKSSGSIGQEEVFDIFTSKKENDNFLTYKEEYGTYSGTIINDPDIVDVDD